MNEFWPEAYPTSARNNLKTTLSSIKRMLRDAGTNPEEILDVARESVRWKAPTWIDTREFEGCSANIADERARAIALYRGEFAPGDGNLWAEETRQRLAVRFEQLLRSELASAPSPQIAEQLLAIDPFSDEAYNALIESAVGAGDHRTAQAIYRRYAAALAEIDAEPPVDLAARVGIRKAPTRLRDAFGFWGRADELAELQRMLASGESRVVLLSGIGGIGKTTLANRAAQGATAEDVTLIDVEPSDVRGDTLEIVQRAGAAKTAILCAHPEALEPLRAVFPDAEEIVLGGLTHEEVVFALRRRFSHMRTDVVDAIWQRSSGHPLVLETIVSLVDDRELLTAADIERLRLPRELERRFERQLQDAGSDAVEVAVLLALEPQLDNDDLAALLGWNLMRSVSARERLALFQYAVFAEVALRMLSPGRRQQTIERITERLKLHEDPRAKVRVAEHLLELKRPREAAASYLEAGTAFATFASWENAVRAAERGIEILDAIATSAEALDILRNLYLVKGHAIYQQGGNAQAVRSLNTAVEIASGDEHAAFRATTLTDIGHALARMGLRDQAWGVAKQALEESARTRDGALGTELAARHLMSRVLRDRSQYMESLAVAEAGFERALDGHEWNAAMHFANILIEVSRRLMHFKECYRWAERQLEAALLAGPVLEAEARFMFATVKFVLNRHNEALEDILCAMPLIEGVRPRNALSTTPVEQLQWMLHHALGHARSCTGAYDEAVVEVEWLARSPWTLNNPVATAQLTSLAIDMRFAMGSNRDIAAARSLLDRVPAVAVGDLASPLDMLARARVGAREGRSDTVVLLHKVMDGLNRMAKLHPDQVHPSLYVLGEAAQGVDDLLAARATELAREHEQRVIEAAGDLWGRRSA